MPITLDRTDKALLNALQGNARLTVAELADRVSLTTSPCWRRVRNLEESGVISGYQAILSPKALGYGVTAFVSIMMESHTQEIARAFEQRLLDIPEIVACHNVSGRYDFCSRWWPGTWSRSASLRGRCCRRCRASRRSIRVFPINRCDRCG
jgi:Transcriptional regulators